MSLAGGSLSDSTSSSAPRQFECRPGACQRHACDVVVNVAVVLEPLRGSKSLVQIRQQTEELRKPRLSSRTVIPSRSPMVRRKESRDIEERGSVRLSRLQHIEELCSRNRASQG